MGGFYYRHKRSVNDMIDALLCHEYELYKSGMKSTLKRDKERVKKTEI